MKVETKFMIMISITQIFTGFYQRDTGTYRNVIWTAIGFAVK